jgi:HD domain
MTEIYYTLSSLGITNDFYPREILAIARAMENKDTKPDLPPFVVDRLPQTEICKATLNLAWRVLSKPIFNHCVRTFLLARWLAEKEGSEWGDASNLPLLFAACVCHDLGASDAYNGSQRFEVEGADAAKTHLLSHGISESESHQVWIAIALHTSPGIAERIYPLSRMVRYGVMMDFSAATRMAMGAVAYSTEIETHLPRLDIEKVLGDTVVHQADLSECVGRPAGLSWPSSAKHPKASWPGILLRAHLENPTHEGVNPAF